MAYNQGYGQPQPPYQGRRSHLKQAVHTLCAMTSRVVIIVDKY